MYTFGDKKSKDKLRELILQYEDFKKDKTSSFKATELSTNAWHIIDWIFNEFKEIHGQETITDFRNTLYPECESLKIMHDIANGSKHSKVSRPKASIKNTEKHLGQYSNAYSREYNITYLKIELENGQILHFTDEIEMVISFWKNYFKNKLGIEV